MLASLFSGPQPKFYYGWIIVGICFLNLAVAMGIWYSFSVFYLAVIKDFGWSRDSGASIFSIFIFCTAFSGPLSGRLLDRFGPRLVMPAGGALLAGALVLVSFSQSLWFFRVSYGILTGLGISLMGFTTNSALISRWFDRRRGTAVGIASAGIGIGMMALIPLAERWIVAFGWRGAYLCIAGLVAGLIIPLNLLLACSDPGSMGLEMEGGARRTNSNNKPSRWRVEILDSDWASRAWTLAAAVRTKPFWLLMLAYCCSGFTAQSTLMHAASAMVDSGMTMQLAAVYLGLVGIFNSSGKVIFGALSDRLGRETTYLITVCISTMGLLALIFIDPQLIVLAFSFALLFGLGYGGGTTMMPASSGDLFMGGSFGVIFAMIFMGTGVGGSLGPYVCGLLRDATGNYFLTLSLCMATLWVSLFLLWKSGPGKVRRMARSRPDEPVKSLN